MNMNKRGMLDDLFDLSFMVVIFLFALIFVNGALSYNIQKSQTISLQQAADTNRMLSAITNLRTQIYQGNTIDPQDLDLRIAQSKVLGGKVISGCWDYYTAQDCNDDVVGLYAESGDYCSWSESRKQCDYHAQVMPT